MRPLILALLSGCVPAVDTDDTDVSDTDDTDVQADPTDFGFVYVASEPTLGFSDAGAVFRRGLPHAYDCTESQIDGCSVLVCGDEPLAYDPVDVGPLGITGAASSLALTFTAGEGYDGAFLESQALFTGGETLVASAPGADGPAFSLSAVAPAAVTVTEPAWPGGAGSLTVDRAAAFSFGWTGAAAGSVVANFSSDDQSVGVRCAFPAAGGAASVPATALAALPAGGGYLDIEGVSEASVRVDTWQVGMRVSTHALVAADTPAIASVRLR